MKGYNALAMLCYNLSYGGFSNEIMGRNLQYSLVSLFNQFQWNSSNKNDDENGLINQLHTFS